MRQKNSDYIRHIDTSGKKENDYIKMRQEKPFYFYQKQG